MNDLPHKFDLEEGPTVENNTVEQPQPGGVRVNNRDYYAGISMPPEEDLIVYLASVNSLERLDECNRDINLFTLVFGALVGAMFAIPINWATNPKFEVTNISLGFEALFFMLALACGYYMYTLRQRAVALRQQLKRRQKTLTPHDTL